MKGTGRTRNLTRLKVPRPTKRWRFKQNIQMNPKRTDLQTRCTNFVKFWWYEVQKWFKKNKERIFPTKITNRLWPAEFKWGRTDTDDAECLVYIQQKRWIKRSTRKQNKYTQKKKNYFEQSLRKRARDKLTSDIKQQSTVFNIFSQIFGHENTVFHFGRHTAFSHSGAKTNTSWWFGALF